MEPNIISSARLPAPEASDDRGRLEERITQLRHLLETLDLLYDAFSERRASAVINFLQQACHWKPYRMLTPTGMAESDPAASNDTPEGRAQNRRVSVNVLVSKAIDTPDGM